MAADWATFGGIGDEVGASALAAGPDVGHGVGLGSRVVRRWLYLRREWVSETMRAKTMAMLRKMAVVKSRIACTMVQEGMAEIEYQGGFGLCRKQGNTDAD